MPKWKRRTVSFPVCEPCDTQLTTRALGNLFGTVAVRIQREMKCAEQRINFILNKRKSSASVKMGFSGVGKGGQAAAQFSFPFFHE